MDLGFRVLGFYGFLTQRTFMDLGFRVLGFFKPVDFYGFRV